MYGRGREGGGARMGKARISQSRGAKAMMKALRSRTGNDVSRPSKGSRLLSTHSVAD